MIINSKYAPEAIGPYSQAVMVGDLLFTSGQLGIDRASGQLEKDIESQTHRALINLKYVLQEAGLTFDNCVKTTVFIVDMNDFAKINAIYGEYFASPFPARSCVQVAKLPKNALIEIEAIAHK